MKRLLIALTVLALVVGCRSTPKEQEGAKVEDRKPVATTPTTPPTTPPPSTAGVQTQPTGVNPLKDPNNILSKRSVYFDYDQYVVKDEFRPIVTSHAKYLSSNQGRRITIQGNTDERGSREYNLALGQRRAESVKRAMTVLGVGDGRIETISYGEEKPVATGKDESAWAQNRRADIKYAGE